MRAWLAQHGGLAVAVLSFGAVALAVALQFMADMPPCAWCTFQRLLYLAVGTMALVSWLLARGNRAPGVSMPMSARLVAALSLLLALGGVAAALWQQFVASKTSSCALTFADRVIKGLGLDESVEWLFKATAFCDEANVPLLAVPFAVWSALLFGLLTLILAVMIAGPDRSARA